MLSAPPSSSSALRDAQSPDPADLLAPLLAPLRDLRGVGPALSAPLARLIGGERVIDLLFHLPNAYAARPLIRRLADAPPGLGATLVLRLIGRFAPESPARGGARRVWRLLTADETGAEIDLVFFAEPRWIAHPPGTELYVCGTPERRGGRMVLIHPESLSAAEAGPPPAMAVQWPLAAPIGRGHLLRLMPQALGRLRELAEWHDAALLRREGWPGFAAALRALQTPAPEQETARVRARQRLGYDEMLAHQVALALIRGRAQARTGRALVADGSLRAALRARFGHSLTQAQERAAADIAADMTAPRRMLRLLQGDVGSGKTLVAALAMLHAVEAGGQAALMAPTDVLARQHHKTLSQLFPLPVGLLTGSQRGEARREIAEHLADGRLRLVVGTHALFQDRIVFQDLALAVIDEQHRFGVAQRLRLSGKGTHCDMLVMTATPIPRSLLLTRWGEMAVSVLNERPAGRLPITTTLHPIAAMARVEEALARALAQGGRIYWVCPLVAESETSDLAAAEARAAALRERFGEIVALAHGQMAPELRNAALAGFAEGSKRILVATTVIEVGVDVPEANVMVIEQAERFGLAQLHQLRGRVGRGEARSYCLLLHNPALGQTARRRLAFLRDTQDGFAIADADFDLRGGGDALGTRQAGDLGFRLADAADTGMLGMARSDATLLLQRDPALTGPRGRAIRQLLRLFDRRAAMATLAAG
ncbi:MAG: ATP-dependent DNA helicase RecG [Rhodospirillales bacterium]|nr:ATP-dependent DNA helicase RecG [Rhodospirillales bacterium]